MELSIPHTKAKFLADSQDKDKPSSCACSVTTAQMGNSCLALCSWSLGTQYIIFSFIDTVTVIWGNVCCLFPFLSFHKFVRPLATFWLLWQNTCQTQLKGEFYSFIYLFTYLLINWYYFFLSHNFMRFRPHDREEVVAKQFFCPGFWGSFGSHLFEGKN